MMNQKPKRRIILASILAGGGHNTLRDYLYQELVATEDFELHKFTHSDSSYNFFNDHVWGRFSSLYDALYKHIPNEYPAVSAIALVKECEEIVKKVDPEIVICTNFGVCSAFALIKKTLKLNFVNVYALPDYGCPSAGAFPQNWYLKPDAVLVFDETSKNGVIENMKFPANKVYISGYLAKAEFRKQIALNRKQSKSQLINEVEDRLAIKLGISATKRTIILMGGAGGTMNKASGFLKKMAEYQQAHPDFQTKNQFLIITGLNTKYYKKLLALRAKHASWNNIIAIPWIESDVYVKLQLIADFPVLFTIAPATMNELFEAQCGPLIIHKSRRGQEEPNADFVVKEGFGLFLPQIHDLLAKIVQGFSKTEKDEFVSRVENYRKLRIEQVRKLPEVVIKMSDDSQPQGRSKTKRDFHLDINKISPQLLLTIFALLLPSSIILAYAQFYKNKHRILDSKMLNSFTKYLANLKSNN
jgi:UDP-N-acetylglucosamine:LPS N-acetylglucosamine transferase